MLNARVEMVLALVGPAVTVGALASLPGLGAARTPTLGRSSDGDRARAASASERIRRGVLGVAFVAALLSGDVALVVGVGAVAVAVERGLRSHRERRDRLAAASSIVPVLDELARGLRAGLSPAASFDAAMRHAMPATRGTTTRATTTRATRAPTTTTPPRTAPPPVGTAPPELDALLDRWSARGRSAAVDDVIAQLRLGARLGMHPEFVAAVSQSLVEQRQLNDEITAHSSQARASAAVMTVAPLLFFVALVLTDPRAARLMLHSILGLVLLGVGLTLDAIGFVWMRRLATGVAPESGER